MSTRRIETEIEIERLVVDQRLGVDAEQLAEAIRASLARLLANGAELHDSTRLHRVAITVRRAPGRGAVERLGDAVARRLVARAGGRG